VRVVPGVVSSLVAHDCRARGALVQHVTGTLCALQISSPHSARYADAGNEFVLLCHNHDLSRAPSRCPPAQDRLPLAATADPELAITPRIGERQARTRRPQPRQGKPARGRGKPRVAARSSTPASEPGGSRRGAAFRRRQHHKLARRKLRKSARATTCRATACFRAGRVAPQTPWVAGPSHEIHAGVIRRRRVTPMKPVVAAIRNGYHLGGHFVRQ